MTLEEATEEIRALRAQLAALTKIRPMEEAPKDEPFLLNIKSLVPKGRSWEIGMWIEPNEFDMEDEDGFRGCWSSSYHDAVNGEHGSSRDGLLGDKALGWLPLPTVGAQWLTN